MRTILLAEDDEDDYVLFTEALSSAGKEMQLVWVRDGVDLMEKLLGHGSAAADLLFLDINMPRKNGFECLKEIRKNPVLDGLPVVVFSTSNDSDLVKKIYHLGANLFLCKPGSFSELRSAIFKAIDMDWNLHKPYPEKKDFLLE